MRTWEERVPVGSRWYNPLSHAWSTVVRHTTTREGRPSVVIRAEVSGAQNSMSPSWFVDRWVPEAYVQP